MSLQHLNLQISHCTQCCSSKCTAGIWNDGPVYCVIVKYFEGDRGSKFKKDRLGQGTETRVWDAPNWLSQDGGAWRIYKMSSKIMPKMLQVYKRFKIMDPSRPRYQLTIVFKATGDRTHTVGHTVTTRPDFILIWQCAHAVWCLSIKNRLECFVIAIKS